MNFDEIAFDQNRPLVAAHRGACGGNIPCNTIASYEIALRQGADIIELDVSRSRDDQLFVFHPGMEYAHLASEKLICDMEAREVHALRFVNPDRTPTQFPVYTLDDAFEALKGRCLINVDKFWTCPDLIMSTIRRHNINQQIILKTAPDENMFQCVEALAPDTPYMIVVRENDLFSEQLVRRPLRYVGAEVLFNAENQPVASADYLQKMHDRGLLVWVNSIVYDYREVLSAGHNDDLSMTNDPALGWGWLLEKGFDIIQTDWTYALRQYISASEKV